MTVTSKIAQAFPNGSSTADNIRQKLAAVVVNVIATADDIQDIDYSQVSAVAVPDVICVRDTLLHYARDPDDVTSVHDGVTILVSDDGKVFKSDLSPAAFVNVLSVENAPPVGAATGDRHIVGTAPTGDFVGHADEFTYLNGAGDWVFVAPVIGQVTYNRDLPGHIHWSEDGEWQDGVGVTTIEEEQVGARELGFPWGMVVESETATPPGTRATGATPTMPLGGTAANINDNSAATEATTSALGDLSAANANSRVIARLDLGADTALRGIEVVGIKASTGSSSASAMKLAYATAAAPTTWVDLGSGFTLTASDQTIARSGSFTARYIAVITEAKNWSTATHTLDDLNAYKLATSIADGTKYIVGANAIGAYSGQDTKIAEAWGGEFRFYAPYDGAIVFDRNRKNLVRYDSASGTWLSAGGFVIGGSQSLTAGTGSTSTAGTGTTAYSNTVAPTTTTLHRKDDVGITYTARAAGNILEFRYRAALRSDGTGRNLPVGILRDSEVNAVDWIGVESGGANDFLFEATFYVVAADTSAHTYKPAIWAESAGGTQCTQMGRRYFSVRELAA